MAAALVLALAACGRAASPATAPQPEPVRTEPLADAAIAAIAELIEMEDRHQLRLVRLRVHAASQDPVVRARTALGVARIGDAEGAPIVRTLLADPDTGVAATAAFAAGVLRDAEALRPLLTLLAPPRDTLAPTVAAEAARALGRLATVESAEVLANYLLGTDTAAVQRNLPVLAAAIPAAVEAGVQDIRAFTRWLAAPEAELRRRAVEALAALDRPATASSILPLLADPAPEVRAVVLRALAATDQPLPPSAGASLLALTADSSQLVRTEAAAATVRHAGALGEATVVDLIRTGDPHRRAAAIEAVGQGPRAPPPFVSELTRVAGDLAEPADMRARAIRALAALDPEATASPAERLGDDSGWRIRAARAAAAHDLASVRAFLTDPDPRVGRLALEAAMAAVPAGEIHRLRPVLIEAVQAGDLHLRASALRGLARVADLALFPLLLDAYQAASDDLEIDAQLAAIDALDALRSAGVLAAPERAFFARFGPARDARVRQHVYDRFGAAAERYWGAPIPVESPRAPPAYRALAARWIAPIDTEAARPHLLLRTERGDVLIELYGDHAPLTVANFLALTEVGFFDGQEIAALEPGRWLVAGDPRGDLAGGPGYLLRPEPSRVEVVPGSLVMAASRDAAHGSRFFIALAPGTIADGATTFGRVIEGFDTLAGLLPGDRILAVQEMPGEE